MVTDRPSEAHAAPPIDWHAPWWAPLAPRGAPALARWAGGAAVADALNATSGAPVRFVPQAALPAGAPYERLIFA